MKKPVIMKVSDDVWEQTSKSIQESVSQISDDYQKTEAENGLLHQRVRWLRTAAIFTSIIAVGLIILLAVVGILFVRPYLRVMRAESAVVVPCIYGPSLTYRVQERDTLFGISMFYDVPVEAIASANGITDVNRIEFGQDITIPASPCVDPVVNTRIAGEPMTATIVLATEYVGSTQTESVRMTQNSPTNLTATAAQAETVTAQYTPPNLTQTTATPTTIDPLELTATEIIESATQQQIELLQQTSAALTTPTPSPTNTTSP
ncbi:MAG: LysM peptidoglycan-binding domain-containing protein [Anaerolineae bacterium]|nr:LysM peptidoglycan-binding domain-containing protein [Anaerolineae bacterium]